MLVLQGEYRMPLWRRLGAAAFGGLGQLGLNRFKYSVGWGLRYNINPKERLNLRLDLGFTSGTCVTIGEAFNPVFSAKIPPHPARPGPTFSQADRQGRSNRIGGR
jgi:hypothetical protein